MKRTLPSSLAVGLLTLTPLPCRAEQANPEDATPVQVESVPAESTPESSTPESPSPTTANTTETITAPPAVDAVVVIELLPAPTSAEAPIPASTYALSAAPQPLGAQEITPEDVTEEDADEERPFSIGLSGVVGARDATDGLVMTWTAGIDLAYRVAPWVRLALRRLTVGHAETSQGDRTALGASPAIDFSVPLGEVVEPYAELGVTAQARLGGRSPTFGFAPFVAAGARFHVIEWLSVGAEVALTVPATEHVLIGHELFPRASILVQVGTSVEARF